MIDWPRLEVMKHMMKPNLAMCVGRAGHAVGSDAPWNIVFCSEMIEDLNLFYRGGNVNFPLYTYKNQEKTPNLNSTLVTSLQETFGSTPSPEQIFYYIYAILYSNRYREKYAAFLRTDFPKVPITKEQRLFMDVARLGKGLVELHLIKSGQLDALIAKFQGDGDNTVEKPEFKEKNQLFINRTQYFTGIEKEVWEYFIGGYQILHKWLKDRIGRKLSLEEIKHFCRVATALRRTLDIQKEVDVLYLHIERSTLEFKENSLDTNLKDFAEN
jgi:predicted helicase